MGLLDTIKDKYSSMDEYQRKNMMLGLAEGFAGMTSNPNAQQIIAGIQNQRKNLQSRMAGNKTLESMRLAGIDPKLIALAEGNPELSKNLMDSYFKQQMGVNKHMIKYSTPKIDPDTGGYYVIATDPNTNKTQRIDVEDATGVTPQQKIDMELAGSLKQADISKAQEVGQQAFGRASVIDEMIGKLQRARRAVVEGGATSGIIAKHIPSFDAATSELKSMANQLGIDIINSATFGALSEKELNLALSTGLDMSLQGQQLVDHIDQKIEAQTKLRNSLLGKARTLTQGNTTYSSYIQAETEEQIKREAPIPNYASPELTSQTGMTITQEQLDRMNPDQRKLFDSLFTK